MTSAGRCRSRKALACPGRRSDGFRKPNAVRRGASQGCLQEAQSRKRWGPRAGRRSGLPMPIAGRSHRASCPALTARRLRFAGHRSAAGGLVVAPLAAEPGSRARAAPSSPCCRFRKPRARARGWASSEKQAWRFATVDPLAGARGFLAERVALCSTHCRFKKPRARARGWASSEKQAWWFATVNPLAGARGFLVQRTGSSRV